MPITQANELLQGNPEAGTSFPASVVLPYDISADRQRLQSLVWKLQQHITPLVAIESLDEKPWAGYPRHQPESVFGDIRGVAHLFGGERGLLKAVDHLVAAMGFQVRMAIADSLGAAWALAHGSDARNAAEAPIVHRNDLRVQLGSLPVQTLRLDSETVTTLGRLGVHCIEELLRLPRSGLVSRLGRPLVRRIEQVLCERDEPLTVEHAPAEHTAGWTLQYPTVDRAILEDRLKRLTGHLAESLQRSQQGALRIKCDLKLTEHAPGSWEIGLFAPSADAEHLCSLILPSLERRTLSSAVEHLQLQVTLCGPLRSTQVTLFRREDDWSETLSGTHLSRLIDSLSGRLGSDAVVGVEMRNNPLPEKAFAVTPLAGNRRAQTQKLKQHRRKTIQRTNDASSHLTSPASRNGRTHLPSIHDALRRPLCLFPEPVPLKVALAQGEFRTRLPTHQLPERLRIGGRLHRILHHWGPERIETGWWKGPCIGRDYYRIETDQQQWWWIYRDHDSGQWMWHGVFG